MKPEINIALAHDSFTQLGGSERVFDCIHELYPDAPVYTLVADEKYRNLFDDWDLRTSFIQHLYLIKKNLQYWLIFIPLALKFMKPQAKVVLSSSSSFIRNLNVDKNSIHVNYCHTPARFLWGEQEYAAQELPKILKPLYPLLMKYLSWMQKWDYAHAQKVTHFIANSAEVQSRIKKYYNRDSVVIHPFVDVNFWKPTRSKQDYFLIAGRLHAHKNNEKIVEIFNELGWPLHVVGTGRQEEYLRSIAKPNITFLGRVSDEVLRDEYSGAKGYIYPQFEDFGMMPLEAAACGTATLGLARGGSLETIEPGVSGELFSDVTKDSIKTYIQAWDHLKYNLQALQNHANKFSKESFKRKLTEFMKPITETL
ncbi:MAG: glycosyltransferase [Candidatus Doudnabacteria bacterium]|nr:glycosyltransferase [Candidatus Doudnabacteria bacterium]